MKLTQSRIAEALGVHPAMIVRWKRRGMPVCSVEEAAAWRSANVRPRMPSAPIGIESTDEQAAPPSQAGHAAPVTDYHKAKTQREAAEAHLAQLRLHRLGASLMDATTARRAVCEAFDQVRAAVCRVPVMLAPIVAGLTDPREIELAYQRTLAATLSDISGRLQVMAQRGGQP